MKPDLHERKWEIDSLCYPVRLPHGYWKATGDTSVFDSEWRAAAGAIVRTFREQQRKDGPGPYSFRRVTSVSYDTAPLGGYGNPTRKVGLVHSAFRPSDDACIFPFLVPSNHFAVAALRQLAVISETVTRDAPFAADCRALADEVAAALARHALVPHPRHGAVSGYMHEAFDPDDPAHFTRAWFAWANTLFGELVLRVRAERPRLLRERL